MIEKLWLKSHTFATKSIFGFIPKFYPFSDFFTKTVGNYVAMNIKLSEFFVDTGKSNRTLCY